MQTNLLLSFIANFSWMALLPFLENIKWSCIFWTSYQFDIWLESKSCAVLTIQSILDFSLFCITWIVKNIIFFWNFEIVWSIQVIVYWIYLVITIVSNVIRKLLWNVWKMFWNGGGPSWTWNFSSFDVIVVSLSPWIRLQSKLMVTRFFSSCLLVS